MVLTKTPLCDFNAPAIPFALQGIDNNVWDLEKAKEQNGLLVIFICNHCPYVRAIINRLVADCQILQANQIGCIAVMSNDTANYPEDSFDKMKEFSKQHGFTFPYVIDELQSVAKNYDAVCTPDFFGYNSELLLQYRGRFDNAGINPPDKDTVKELLPSMLQVANTGNGPKEQQPSIGCSIKWK